MAGQGSARVTLREIDLSQVRNPQQLPQGVPAAVVGPARKGPAFVPQTFATMQQFNEVFGNMLEVGREGNSNQFGPLALNEWMRSAQAGTYLRVLGVGDGLPASGGKTSEAGFVVGQKQLQLQDSDLAKVGDNPHAAIEDSTAALALGRTHMLGCFMKDSTGSNYLKDAGVESEGAAASLVIEFGAKPSANDTFVLDVVDNTGALIGAYTVTFVDGAAGANQVQINGADTVLAVMQALEALLDAEFGANIVTITEDISSTGNGSSARMTITSGNPEQLDSTNDCVVKFNLNNADTSLFSVGDKTGSVSSQTFSYGIEGDVAAHTEITILKQPEVGSTITLNALSNDGNNVIDDAKVVVYTFVANGAVTSYDITGAGTASVEIGTTKEQTLSNLKAAILDTTDGTTSNHRGLFTTVSNAAGDELTITQVNAGDDGNTAIALSADNGAGDTGLSVAAADAATANTAQNLTLTSAAAGDQSGFMYGGLNGTETSFTIQLLGQPNVNDTFTLKTNDKDADGTLRTQAYRFNNTGPNGTSQDGNATIDINIGESVQETLVNLKYVLDSSHADSVNVLATLRDSIDAVLDDATDSVKISQVNPGGNNSGIITKYDMTFEISENFVLTNPDGDRLVGNHGEKSENFSGGGGAAAPVIRGVLMTPQGVRASLDVNDQLTQFSNRSSDTTNARRVSDSNLRSAAHGKSFGGTSATDLAGYVVGEVDSNQGFKLILNGYSNTQNPAVLDCSFNPNSPSYFAKVLNTDPTKMEELGHYLYAHWDIDPAVAAPSNAGLRHAGGQISGNYADMKGFLVAGAAGRATSADGKPDYEDFSSKFATAKTPWIVSQFYSAGADDAARPATASAGGAVKLFRLHSVDDGVISNGQFRLLISNLRYGGENDFGSFDMSLESFASDPIRGNVIAAWKNANLDPNSRNFIGRLVGDKHIYYDFESDLGKQRLREEGQYERKNPFVRIELSDALKQGDVEIDALPTGFQGHAHLFTKSNGNFLELDVAEGNRVFTDAANLVTETLSQAQVAPLDFVTSINRKEGSELFSDDDLAWGVKFSLRENAHVDSGNIKGHKELTEQVFNKSISSWAKFFPSFGSNPAWVTGDDADSNQNSFFSLEKIAIPSSSLDGDSKISAWDGATYKRKPSDTPGGRFVKISKDALGGNAKYLKFRCMFQGGFDGVDIFDEEKAELTGIASLREGEDETNSQKFTGPTILAYQRAIDVLTDKSATEFQLLAIPGQRSPRVTDYAITACEDRFDALFIMDIVEKDALGSLIEDSDVKPHVRNTISLFADRVLDTSFAAAYFPDVVVRRPADNAPIVVPPSVGMLGVMSRNDSIADPWFAPAGLNRGRLSAIDSRVQMNRDLLDDLYDADINPIYVPAGRSGEVYAFGQKTLLQDASALDRINVRRLLIDIRRKVKKIGEQLLFEPNRASTLARFSALVEPIMANVQERRGVTRYKVQIDSSTTTQNDIENNTIRGKIYLQPTKSVEFISLDFVVTNTIQQ